MNEKKTSAAMGRNVFYISIFFMLCLIFTLGKTEPVQAAGYQTVNANSTSEEENRTVGKTTFEFDYASQRLYAIKGGEKKLLASDAGLSSIIITNGNTVYYNTYKYGDKATVYCISSIGKKAKKLFSVKADDPAFSLEGLYKGKIYYVKGIDPGKFCSYTIKTKKHKAIAGGVTSTSQYKQYFYLMPYRGAIGPVLLRVYNAKTGAVKTISKKYLFFDHDSRYLYYAEVKKGDLGDSSFNVAIKRCSLGGSGKKTLLKSLDVRYITKITKDSVTYVDVGGKERTKTLKK